MLFPTVLPSVVGFLAVCTAAHRTIRVVQSPPSEDQASCFGCLPSPKRIFSSYYTYSQFPSTPSTPSHRHAHSDWSGSSYDTDNASLPPHSPPLSPRRVNSRNVLSDYDWSNVDDVMAGDLEVHSTPFHAAGKHIVDLEGRRVKLACLDLMTDERTMLPNDLIYASVDQIAGHVKQIRFNCVRYNVNIAALMGLERRPLAYYSVDKQRLLLQWNPQLRNATVLSGFIGMMEKLESLKLFVILQYENKQKYFASRMGEWLEGVRRLTRMANGHENVVGVGLQSPLLTSEYRGSARRKRLQFLEAGAQQIHAVNSRLLILLNENLDPTDSTLDALKHRLVVQAALTPAIVKQKQSIRNFVMFGRRSSNEDCSKTRRWLSETFTANTPLLISPLSFHSEASVVNYKWMSCVSGWLRENDVDFAYSTKTGTVMSANEDSAVWSNVKKLMYVKQGPGIGENRLSSTLAEDLQSFLDRYDYAFQPEYMI